jgi:hypothetical protein
MRLITIALLILVTLGIAQAEPRQSKDRNHNYILRCQEAGLVSGVPTLRRIIGKREIDVYPNGLMFEKTIWSASASADFCRSRCLDPLGAVRRVLRLSCAQRGAVPRLTLSFTLTSAT